MIVNLQPALTKVALKNLLESNLTMRLALGSRLEMAANTLASEMEKQGAGVYVTTELPAAIKLIQDGNLRIAEGQK